MNALEPQLGEDATVRAPANWLELQREYPIRRRVNLRDVIELVAVVAGAALAAWLI